MKNIRNYDAKKYIFGDGDQQYVQIQKGIYQCGMGKNTLYVTSLSFVQEPDYGEGKSSSYISQFPLEDLLDKYYCHISDFYEELNDGKSEICYLEFASADRNDIVNLRNIIGKHVYIVKVNDGEKIIEKLVIE